MTNMFSQDANAVHAVKKRRKYATHNNLRKRCKCSHRSWLVCPHYWNFHYMAHGRLFRGSLFESDPDKARAKFSTIRAQIDNGIYVPPDRSAPAPTVLPDRPTFAMVAEQYEKDPEGLTKLSDSAKRHHRHQMEFLGTAIVPPSVPFTEKPFADIIRGDLKVVEAAKTQPGQRTYTNDKGATWTKAVGG